jgi:hypothetical protein
MVRMFAVLISNRPLKANWVTPIAFLCPSETLSIDSSHHSTLYSLR